MNHFTAPARVEVDIVSGMLIRSGFRKRLKQQPILQRIDIGDVPSSS